MYFTIFSLAVAVQTVLCAENNIGGYSYSRFRGPVSGAIQRIQVSAAAMHDRLNAPQNSQLNKVDYVAKPDYHFEYAVVDPITGNQQSHSEQRDGDTVTGQYSVVEPDGRLRVVQYTADAKNGFRVMIHYHGKSNTDDDTTENSNNNALRHHGKSQNNVKTQNGELNQFINHGFNNNRPENYPGQGINNLSDKKSGTESYNNGRTQPNQRNRYLIKDKRLNYPEFVLNHGKNNANNQNSDKESDDNGRAQQNQGHHYLVNHESVPNRGRESENDDLNSGTVPRGFEKSRQVAEPKEQWNKSVKEGDKNGPVQFQNEEIQNENEEVKEDDDYEENDEVEPKKEELRDDDDGENEELANYNDYEERDGELKNENDERVEDYDE